MSGDVAEAVKTAIDVGALIRAVDPVLAMVAGGALGVWLTRFFTPKGLVTKEHFDEVVKQLREDVDKCHEERADIMRMFREATVAHGEHK